MLKVPYEVQVILSSPYLEELVNLIRKVVHKDVRENSEFSMRLG